MATRALLADLAREYERRSGQSAAIEAVGGVDAAQRVQSGEDFDLVFLAADVIDRLAAAGHLLAGRVDLVRSGVAVAVRQGAAVPNLSNADALKAAVLSAASIGYSTGPSGVALIELFKRWGIFEAVASRLVQARPGVPVAGMVNVT